MDEKTRDELYNALAEVPPMANIFVPNLPKMVDIVYAAVSETIGDPVIVWVGGFPRQTIVDLAILDKNYKGKVYASKVIWIGEIDNDLYSA